MSYYSLKILLAGDGAVGKTSIAQRFIRGKFITNYTQTVGVDVSHKEIKKNGDIIAKLAIWDIAGQDHYNFMRQNFYYGTDGVVLIFDLTRHETFEHLGGWIEEIRKQVDEEVPFILVGNKVDLIEDVGEVVDHKDAVSLAEDLNLTYREASAKSGLNIEIIFQDLTDKIIKNKTYGIDVMQKLWGKKD